MRLMTPAFDDGDPIPIRYTGDGQDVSPPFVWSDLPRDTEDVALICEDHDVPDGKPFVHWLVCHLPISGFLPEAVPKQVQPYQPASLIQGCNSFGQVGYGGPAPPRGHGMHRYLFRIYALDRRLDPGKYFDKAGLIKTMEGHILEEAEMIGTYARSADHVLTSTS